MLSQIHILLTYTCNFECDHCFLYCGPRAQGIFTRKKLDDVIDEARKVDTIEWIYFEGGEPFLYYPLMVEGIKIAREAGFKVGLVTNGYWATSEEDALLWLEPLSRLQISDFSVSEDSFHCGDEEDNHARRAQRAAKKLGIPTMSICIEQPSVKTEETREKGAPVVGGGVMLKGRAADNLATGLPTTSPEGFSECPHENFVKPGRVHLDPYGNLHICQGVSMGNMFETPLADIVATYDAGAFPVIGPLADGGPIGLAKKHGISHEGQYVDHCHFCYHVRRSLIGKFPKELTPRQVYGSCFARR